MPQTHGTAARHEETKWLRHVQLQLSRGDYVNDTGREIEWGADRIEAGCGAN